MKFKTLSIALIAASIGTFANAGAKQDVLVEKPVPQLKAQSETNKYAKATVDYLSAVKKGDAQAKNDSLVIIQNDAGKILLADYFMSQLYRTGTVEGKTQADGLALLKKTADAGVPEAQHDYGMVLYLGDSGVKKDQKKALDYFTKAAEKGLGNSYHNICVYYEQGIAPIKKDLAKAQTCFKNAADKYHVTQSYGKYSAMKLADPKLDKAGEQEALKYAVLGGNKGDVASIALAGTIMLTAKHNTPNLVGGFKNIQASAEMGYKPAYKVLGDLYTNGVGVAKDKEIGAIWLNRAAK